MELHRRVSTPAVWVCRKEIMIRITPILTCSISNCFKWSLI